METRWRRTAGLAGLIGVLALTGCASKLNGGGFIRSANGIDRANFGFSYDGPSDHFRGTYHDKALGVRLRGTGVLPPPWTPPEDTTACIAGIMGYESQNPRQRGAGTLYLQACDGGSTGVGEDTITINVLTGPFAGYVNSGVVEGGNLKAHD